jgi:lysophospholipase L1-like esterase
VTLLALGDSWPYGAHCNGCTPFPQLYAQGLKTELSREVTLLNLVTNGGTSNSLRQSLASDPSYGDAVRRSDVVMISTGANDMEPAGQSWKAGTCGGADGLDCFRALADRWRTNFDAMLDEVDQLRRGKPTAVRLVTNSNEFLSDPGLIEYFGPDFGLTEGAAISAFHHDALCAVAAEHDGLCVDLRPVLNGPDLRQPRDVNTQEAMQAVADALVATGIPELDRPGTG